MLNTLQEPARRYARLTMNTSIFTDYFQYPHTYTAEVQRGWGEIMVRTTIKAKVGELE